MHGRKGLSPIRMSNVMLTISSIPDREAASAVRIPLKAALIGADLPRCPARRLAGFILLALVLGGGVADLAAQTATNYYTYIYSRWANPAGHYSVEVTGCESPCVASVSNAQAVATSNLTDFAVATLAGISLLDGQHKVAWADLEATAPGGDYAGFVLGGSNVVQLALSNSLVIRTYFNGSVRETSTTNTAFELTPLSAGRTAIAFRTTNAFNRVEVDLVGGVLELSAFNEVTFYYAFAAQAFVPPNASDDFFTLCACAQSLNVLINDVPEPGHTLDPASVTVTSNPTKGSVVVQPDGSILYTGFDGQFGADAFTYRVCHALPTSFPPQTSQWPDPSGHFDSGSVGLCVACSVSNADLVADSSAANFASLHVPVGLSNATVWISADLTGLAEAGDCAGFLIGTSDELLPVAALEDLRLTTYLGGVLQEQSGTAALLNLSLLSLGGDQYELRFVTTKPFDRVRLDIASAASVLQSWRAYYAFSKPCAEAGAGCDTSTVHITIPPNLCCGAVAPSLSR